MLYEIHFQAEDQEGAKASYQSPTVTAAIENAVLELGLVPISALTRTHPDKVQDINVYAPIPGEPADVRRKLSIQDLVQAYDLVQTLKATPATTVFAFKDPETGLPVLVFKDPSKEEEPILHGKSLKEQLEERDR